MGRAREVSCFQGRITVDWSDTSAGGPSNGEHSDSVQHSIRRPEFRPTDGVHHTSLGENSLPDTWSVKSHEVVIREATGDRQIQGDDE